VSVDLRISGFSRSSCENTICFAVVASAQKKQRGIVDEPAACARCRPGRERPPAAGQDDDVAVRIARGVAEDLADLMRAFRADRVLRCCASLRTMVRMRPRRMKAERPIVRFHECAHRYRRPFPPGVSTLSRHVIADRSRSCCDAPPSAESSSFTR